MHASFCPSGKLSLVGGPRIRFGVPHRHRRLWQQVWTAHPRHFLRCSNVRHPCHLKHLSSSSLMLLWTKCTPFLHRQPRIWTEMPKPAKVCRMWTRRSASLRRASFCMSTYLRYMPCSNGLPMCDGLLRCTVSAKVFLRVTKYMNLSRKLMRAALSVPTQCARHFPSVCALVPHGTKRHCNYCIMLRLSRSILCGRCLMHPLMQLLPPRFASA